MAIRPAAPTDLQALEDLRGLPLFDSQLFEDGRWTVVFEDDAGNVLAYMTRVPEPHAVGCVRVDQLYVAAGLKRTGIGTALLECAEADARSVGGRRLVMSVKHGNVEAINCNLRFGCAVVRREPSGLEMAKDL